MHTIKPLRERAKLKQSDVAEAMNVTRQAVCNWEAGIREPKASQLLMLCKVLGCTSDELLGLDRLEVRS